MDCPMCFELYAPDRIARNLLCGHTYCQICLEQVYIIKKRIECPMCRHKHEPNLKPISLSKNFVAMDLASKHLEVRKKLQFCPNHNKFPLQFFCEDDQTHLCTECIVEHSGHKFCKQEHSVPLLKEKLSIVQQKLKINYEILEKQTKANDQSKEQLNNENERNLALLDDQFERLIAKIEQRKSFLKEQQQRNYMSECEQIESDLVMNQSLLQNMQMIYKKLENTQTQLDELKVLKDSSMIKLIDDLEDQADRDIAQQKQLKTCEIKKIPKIVFDNKLYVEIAHFGNFKQEVNHPQICFFGDKHKILIYNIEKDEWIYKQMGPNTLEYNYYAAAVSIPNGDIIITGGGVSKNTMLITPNKGFQSTTLKSMYFHRKEHACVYLDGFVYAIGGYDGSAKQMLSCCERYSIAQDEWKMIEPLVKQKCAFAAASAINKYIYVFGGFDGRERLNTIERYSVKDNQWKVLDVKFKQGFSNAAAIAYDEHKIMILGGGSNLGFSLELQTFDSNEYQINVGKSKMSEGRDLRNKLVIFEDNLYACGGNNCSMEKYSLKNKLWQSLKGYDPYISDNLDSWCSALTFDLIGSTNMAMSTIKRHNQKQQQQYQNYRFEEDLIPFENDGSFNQEVHSDDFNNEEDEYDDNLSYLGMGRVGRMYQI